MCENHQQYIVKLMEMTLSRRSKGLLYSVFGVLALTPDSILIRKVAHVPSFTVLFYRNLIFAVVMLIGLLVSERANSWNKLKALGKWGFLTGILFGASLMFLVLAIQRIAAASVLVIQASNPVFAAIFSWFMLSEAMTRLTLITSAICIGAIILIFAGSLASGGGGGSGGNDAVGLLIAVASSISFGLYIVMLRWLSLFQT